MNWTTEQPTQGGLYFMRYIGEQLPKEYTEPSPVWIYETVQGLRFKDFTNKGCYTYAVSTFPDAEWYGPLLPPPESAAQGDTLREALKSMLHIFDRGLPESSIGRKTCDEAKAALEEKK